MDKSSSLTLNLSYSRRELADTRFKWASLQKFVCLASVYSMNLHNIDVYSPLIKRVMIFKLIFLQIVVGAPYMLMDSFIKQYTKKIGAFKLLNPFLRGIMVGLFLQTAHFSIMTAVFLTEIWRFFITNLSQEPKWTVCGKHVLDSAIKCVSVGDVLDRCRNGNIKTPMEQTSVHHFYTSTFTASSRSSLTTTLFFSGLIWMSNFFISTIAEETLYKMCKFVCVSRMVGTATVLFLTVTTVGESSITALANMMDVDITSDIVSDLQSVIFIYNIGLLSFHDYDVLSAFTMTDNAVIFYMLGFNIEAVLRSWIFGSMVEMLKNCVVLPKREPTRHRYLLSILPMSSQFMEASKIYPLFIYVQLIIGLTTNMTMMTVSMAKLLQSEFSSVKHIYIVGLICFLGFCLTIPIQLLYYTGAIGYVKGIYRSLYMGISYMGTLNTVVILWVYGINNLSTDIHFWLGFKPTNYWRLSWMILPLVCAGMVLQSFFDLRSYNFDNPQHQQVLISLLGCFLFSALIVFIINLKTIAYFLVRNNLGGAFCSNIKKYGPPDPDERQQRRVFNETIDLRKCHHNCIVLDEILDCHHLPLMNTQTGTSEAQSSVTDIYASEDTRDKPRGSVALDIELNR